MLRAVGNDKALRFKAWLQFSYVVFFDAVAGIGLLVGEQVVQQFRHRHIEEISGLSPTLWPTILCGIAAPVLLRSQTPTKWGGWLGGRRLMGPVRKLQQQAEREVEDICTAEETIWLKEEVVHVACLSVEELGDWAERYIKRRALPEPPGKRNRQASVRHIREIISDTAALDEVRRMTIVQVLLDNFGHRAVRQLFRYGRQKAPDRVVLYRSRSYRAARSVILIGRSKLSILNRDIRVPTGFEITIQDERIKVCRPDRTVDDEVRLLAKKFRDELGRGGSVEGIYQGWIVIRPTLGRRARAVVLNNTQHFARLLLDCDSIGNILVQPNGMILDEQAGLFATSRLLACPSDAPRSGSKYCGEAFAGHGAWLAVDIEIDTDIADGRTHKRYFYASAGVPLYLLIDLVNGSLVVHSAVADETYTCIEKVQFGDQLDLPSPANVKLDTSALSRF